MNISRRIYLSLCLCLIFVPGISAQKKNDKFSVEPFTVKTNLLITDDKNFLIDDVRQEDIKIYEDGIEQKITYFAKKAPVLNLALVVDNTGSMRTKLDEILFAGSVIVSNLRPKDEAFIVRFVNSANIQLQQEWTSDQNKLKYAIENMYVEGGQSAVLDAVYLAADELLKREKEDKSKRYAVLLISDVEDRDSHYRYEEVLKLFKDTDLQTFILSYADNAPQDKKGANILGNKLALDTGGTIHNLARKHTKEELVEALKKLVFELRSNYIVGYTSTNPKHDGLQRKLTVVIGNGAKAEKRNALIRDGFTVPKEKQNNFMLKNFVITIIFTALFLPNIIFAQTKQNISMLLYNGKIFTADENFTLAEAVAVDGEKIVAVGTTKDLQAKYQAAKEIDLSGKLVTPGFNDAHIHFVGVGMSLLQVDLNGSQTLEEARRRIAVKVKETPKGEWILGRGWDHTLVE